MPTYNLLLILGLILTSPYYLFLILWKGKYRAPFWGKFGFLPKNFKESLGDEPVIWIHAVSVGEVAAAAPIIKGLALLYPQKQLVISTTTETGQRQAERLFPEIPRCYMPLDLPPFLRRAFTGVRIELFLIMETELWPNLIEYLKNRRIRSFVINGRISDRSFRRYRLFKGFFKRVMRSVRGILAQSDADAERFAALGAPEERVIVVGNTKFDQVKSEEPPADLKVDGPVIVAGSTHPGEEEIIIESFSRVLRDYPTLHLILVPRHPDRTPSVANLCRRHHIPFALRSKTKLLMEPILIVDVIGELTRLYALASISFVGGSLVPKGGHNLLEASIYGTPVLCGPHTENFREIARILDEAGLIRVADSAELEAALRRLLKEPETAQQIGLSLQQATLTHRGATALTLSRLQREILT